MHEAYIVQVNQLRPHSNADRLQIATFFGNDVCVGLDVKIGDIGIYFPTDLQLSEEYCKANNLVRKLDADGKNIGGYLDPRKRNVTTIKLRGEYSDGLYASIDSLKYTGVAIGELNIGDGFTVINGHKICDKYIPATKPLKSFSPKNQQKKKKVNIAPLFKEHEETQQLAYNLNAFLPKDQIEITLKMHGTSGRTGYLPVLKGYKRTLLDRILGHQGTPIYEYDYVSGTRKTVLNKNAPTKGYYNDNTFRFMHEKEFYGKLHKGETCYYEIVGYVSPHKPIMEVVNNKKVNDKDFVTKYGRTTIFSYGCNATLGESKLYVYRMTMTNEDGDVVEYSPDFMRYRCKQMGIKTVPVFEQTYLDTEAPGEHVKELAEKYYDGEDPIGKTHVREGVVVRVVNRPKFVAYKHKNYSFKILEGIIKSNAEIPDMEEAEEI